MSEPTIEQRRARAAWQAVSGVKGKSSAGEYCALAQGAPADIQTNGLGQVLAFWRAKGSKVDSAHRLLFDHVSAWVLQEMEGRGQSNLLSWVMDGDSDGYRRATTEALAYLVWIKRFAEAELGDG